MDPLTHNTFDYDAEMWHGYDYDTSVKASRDVFHPAAWKRAGGVGNSGCIQADDSRWSVSAPEDPPCILPFIIYRKWASREALDLRNAQVSVYLRGDNLSLKGARCFFWCLSLKTGTRWHFTGRPLPIEQGRWSEKPVTFALENKPSRWRRSWALRNGPLEDVLRQSDCYGFSFIGFTGLVTGKLSMDEFNLIPAAG